MSLNYTHLSRTVSLALRHRPKLYSLTLDENGWVAVADLLNSLRKARPEWEDLAEADLVRMNEQASKRRFEIADGRIRALYGHSYALQVRKKPTDPPKILYHGTTDRVLDVILEEGLKPMRRQYVHFATDRQMVVEVASRKQGRVVVLEILAGDAYTTGVPFYHGADNVWLADFVPPEFIRVVAD